MFSSAIFKITLYTCFGTFIFTELTHGSDFRNDAETFYNSKNDNFQTVNAQWI